MTFEPGFSMEFILEGENVWSWECRAEYMGGGGGGI